VIHVLLEINLRPIRVGFKRTWVISLHIQTASAPRMADPRAKWKPSLGDLRIDRIQTSDQGRRLDIEFDIGGKIDRVYFISNKDGLNENKEALIALALLPAMKKRLDIIIGGSVSPTFLAGINVIQTVFCDWKPRYRRAKIKDVKPLRGQRSQPGRVGQFFSGGLDSLYTLIKRKDEITDLIYIHGFDIPLDDLDEADRALERARQVAGYFEKNLVEIETNVQSFHQRYIFWGLSHGAALAAVGHMLTPGFKRFYFPSAGTYPLLPPWGMHPLLDPYWSSEALDILSDGYEAVRPMKTELVAEYKIAMETLRVCMRRTPSGLNCGQCEKCTRMLVDLRIAGVRDTGNLFDNALDLNNIARFYRKEGHERYFLGESLEYLIKEGGDPELEDALSKVLARRGMPERWVKGWRKLSKKVFPITKRG